MTGSSVRVLLPRQSSVTVDPNASPGEQVLQLLANPFQSQLQAQSVGAALGTSLGISALLALLFCISRPRNTLVYAPKLKTADSKHAPPPLGKGMFSWIPPVRQAKEDFLADKIGLDAVIFLRFTRMLRNVFLILALIGLCVMIPVNVTQGNKAIIGDNTPVLTVMTPLFVFGNGLWAQVVVAWATDLVIMYFLWRNYRAVVRLRKNYMSTPEYQSSLYARTVLIRDIPDNARSDAGILELVEANNPTGIPPRTTIGRNVKVLPDLIEEHEESVRQLESILAKYMKNPDRLPAKRPTMKAPSKFKGQTMNGKVDAIEYLTDRIRQLEIEINEIRERVGMRDPMPYGFASWDSVSQAHAVAYAARGKRQKTAKLELAPRPSDLIWKNLPLTRAQRRRKRIANAVWIVVLTIIWTPINGGIAIFLSNLSNLGLVWPGFQHSLNAHQAWWAVVQGIAAPALTSAVYLLLPIIFRRLQIRAGDHTKSSREHHVLRNLYGFFTFNNLVVFSVFSAVWQWVTAVIDYTDQGFDIWSAIQRGDIALVLTISLCQISPFWVTWLLQRNLGAAIDLAQLWQVTYVWFARTFMAPTPRQNIEWTAAPPFEYSSYYNYFLFYTTVALCYSTLQPIVLLVTAFYFSVDAFLKKYLLMYVFITKNESGGRFWTMLFNRIVFAVILSNCFIAVVVKARGGWSLVIALAPLVVIMLGFKWYCARTFDAELKYYARSVMEDHERLAHGKSHRPEKTSSKFGHPALYKPLMTPMVHAKAKHILSDIYKGRVNSESAQAMAFSDIAMQPMTQTGHPRQEAPFELVPESQQDFAFYKDRSDFRDEGGDIYGDSRSQTPISFTGKEGVVSVQSPSSSRAASPGPGVTLGGRLIPKKQPDQMNMSMQSRSPPARGGDLSMRPGPYTDPYDDQANLLRSTGDLSAPSGEFMPMERWQTDDSTKDSSKANTPADELNSGYDYFRGRR